MASRLQTAFPGWLVMWSPWRRTFTAFASFTPNALVMDEPTTDRLIDQMRMVERRPLNLAARR
ncbi:hypothetical protein [Thermomonospora umbrina]|uniref:Uncharacterized protein n=1 Tax=Thermomonospora umbrina TaxID=111806 RepID=A0A3D9SLJ9_9ACTN|nr:hypothetical protein [Thermomonospora umbrina]REE96789.1 hypothetical protein DFJ69_2238 [Thermomonospora umbrina]